MPHIRTHVADAEAVMCHLIGASTATVVYAARPGELTVACALSAHGCGTASPAPPTMVLALRMRRKAGSAVPACAWGQPVARRVVAWV